MNTYTAITIGPIYKTMVQARKTRELWAGSYLFSYLMKQIILNIQEGGATFLLPSIKGVRLDNGQNIDLLKEVYETGLFPDRLIINPCESSFDEISKAIDNAIDTVVNNISTHLKNPENIKDYLSDYFQVYIVQQTFDADTKKCEITKALFGALDILELQTKVPPVESQPFIQHFLTQGSFKRKNQSFLIKDSKILSPKDKFRFESLIEISARDLLTQMDDSTKVQFEKLIDDEGDDEHSIVDWLKKQESIQEQFKTYHKYIAIVHIDGDNFGKLNGTLDDADFLKFSDCLSKYSLEISERIAQYGGLPVYIGGDDALFFAPVRNANQNIFTLLDDIDAIFQKEFASFLDGKYQPMPSLSAGVSITYYKHPLEEALTLSRGLLDSKAKKYPGKNAIAFEVVHHSGQSYASVFKKENDSGSPYQAFKELIELAIEDEHFLNSVVQKSLIHHPLLKEIHADSQRLRAFRTNFYNENTHQSPSNDAFLNQLEKLIQAVYSNSIHLEKEEYLVLDNRRNELKRNGLNKYDELKKNNIYSALRMAHFLNRKDTDHA